MTEKSDDAIIGEYIDKIVRPIFEKVPQEMSKNPMWVGGVGQEKKDFSYFQPHNIRRVFDFSHNFFVNRLYIKTHLKGVGLKLFNNGKEIHIKKYKECSIRIRKNSIQITNMIEHKKWYLIDNYKAKEMIEEIIKTKEVECIKVLKCFISEYGGHTEFKLQSSYTEPKIKSNPVTQALPEDLVWHEKHHKKVYREKEIELYDINNAIKLIDESIFFRHEPMIAKNLKLIYSLLMDRKQSASPVFSQPSNSHSELQKVEVFSRDSLQILSIQELLNLGLDMELASEYRRFMKEMRA